MGAILDVKHFIVAMEVARLLVGHMEIHLMSYRQPELRNM